MKGFVLSFNFIPYISSASIDFFKKIKNIENLELDVVHIQEQNKNEHFFDFYEQTVINRYEIPFRHNPSSTNPLFALKITFFWLWKSLRLFQKKKKEYNFVMSHAFSMLSHLSALFIKQCNPKIPWIAYYSDPVKYNPYFEHKYIPTGMFQVVYLWIEQKSFQKADSLIFTNEFQLELSLQGKNEIYKEKAYCISHCFDQQMFDYAKEVNQVQGKKNPKFILAHLGTMFPPKRQASEVMQALDELYSQDFDIVELHLIGKRAEADYSTWKNMKHKDAVKFIEPVDYFTSLELMLKADALLLIDADFSEEGLEYSPFLPGKYSEYIGAKKPVLAVTMEKGAVAEQQKKIGYPYTTNKIADIKKNILHITNIKVDEQADFKSYSHNYANKQMEEIIKKTIKDVKKL